MQNTEKPTRGKTWRAATVLVAEDDDVCREVITRALETRGYLVLAARHGSAAIEIAQNYSATIDVLVTDYFMPDLNGRQLAERVSAMRPGIKVLFMTGYMNHLLHIMSSLEYWSDDILVKPVPPERLDEVIQNVILGRSKASLPH